MATSECWVQDVITCDLCDKPTQQFCNSCQVSLCKDCLSKHTDEFKSVSHEIAPFLDRKIQLMFPECQDHSGQRCEVNCKDCNKPVCLKCIVSGPHKGHDVEELTESYENRRQEIKTETQEIKAKIKKYQKKEADVGIQISETKAKFDDLGKENKKLRQLWHNEVDNIFDKIDSLSHALEDGNLNDLTTYQNKIKSFVSDLNETVKNNEKILKSNKLSDVNSYKSKLKEYLDFPENALNLKIPCFNTQIDHWRELLVEFGDYRATMTLKSMPGLSADISCLTRTGELIAEVRVIATIRTSYTPLNGVACVGESEAWIYGDDQTITRIDIDGSVKGTVDTKCQYRIKDISVTREGELVYSYHTPLDGRVNIVRQGKSETLITTSMGWGPGGLCCTRSGDILVHMRCKLLNSHYNQNKIVCDQGQRITQGIYKDEDGELIFENGFGSLYMSENNNGDLCVSDTNANTVVVVDRKGRVRYRYDRTEAKRKGKFTPNYIVTDALSQIIVTDYKNNCLHILDQDGQFLRCLDIGAGMCGLSVDSKGRLWVGFKESGTINVIEY